jgi:tetratricopeptide (TPR) repeat protein
MREKKKNDDSKKNKKNNKALVQTNPLLEKFQQQTLWHLVLLVFLPFFLYIKTVGYQLINFDDVQIIVNNLDFLNNIKNIGAAFQTDAFMVSKGYFYRPLQTVTLMFDTIIGEGRAWIYHFSNLIYHIFTVISFYYLLRLLKIKNLSALFVALVFSVHPLLASSVSWIPARGDVLIGLFGVLSFVTFIKYLITHKPVFLLLHIAVFLLAIFSKESAILLPVMLFFYLAFMKEQKLIEKLKELIPFIVIWLSIIVFYFILRSKVVIESQPDNILGIKPFINNLPAIPTVIAKFIFPVALSTMPLFNDSYTFIGILFLLLAVWFVLKALKQKNWLVVMGFVWFLLFMLPPMFFQVSYSKYILEYYEHRVYLPIMGLLMIVALVNDQLKWGYKLRLGLSVGIIVIFTFMASVHSDNFKDSVAFFSNATERGNPGASVNRGEYYMEQRDFSNAIKDFNLAIKLSRGEYAPAFYNRGVYYSQVAKDHSAAEADFSRTIALDPSYIDAYIKRASERVFSSNFEGALNDLDRAKNIDSMRVDIYYTQAKVFTGAMIFKESLPFYDKAISMYGYSAEMYNDRAYVKYRIKDYEGALQDCEKAISLMPNLMSAYYNKGIIYLELGKPDFAVKQMDTTLMLTDNFYFGYFYRGMAKKQLKDMKGACEDWQESVRLGFTMAEDTIRKYCK